MHIDAIGAAIDLRNPKINEIDQLFRQAGFLNGGVHPAQSLETFRRNLGVVDAIDHDEILSLLMDSPCRILAYPERAMIGLVDWAMNSQFPREMVSCEDTLRSSQQLQDSLAEILGGAPGIDIGEIEQQGGGSVAACRPIRQGFPVQTFFSHACDEPAI